MRNFSAKIIRQAEYCLHRLAALPTERLNRCLNHTGYVLMVLGLTVLGKYTVTGYTLMVVSVFFIFEEVITKFIKKFS